MSEQKRVPPLDDNNDDKTSVARGATFIDQLNQFAEVPPALVMLVGPAGQVGQQWLLDKENIVIGRAPSSAIFVDDGTVSKSHTKITHLRGEVQLIDLESTNKTVINGNVVPAFVAIRLQNNDQIKIGNVLFKFLEKGSIEAVANQKMHQKSERDVLTQIWNKGALMSKGPEYFQRARAMGVSLSLAVLDLDFFKKINDGFGHAAGDYILREMANVIGKTSIRADDYFARFGGEEFVIILFGSHIVQAQEIGERVRSSIENHKFVFQETPIPVTLSIGVSEQTDATKDWDELFEQADAALYQSKKLGRNRVSSFQS